ncbi:MAG: histidine kinase [Spirochaetales bacterium]|nr:histidine kinase [Spirochaetales bacterium]
MMAHLRWPALVALVLTLAFAATACRPSVAYDSAEAQAQAIPTSVATTPEEALQAWRDGAGAPVRNSQLGACPDGCWLVVTIDVPLKLGSGLLTDVAFPHPYMVHIDNYLLDELELYLYSHNTPRSTGWPQPIARTGTLHDRATVHLGYATWDVPVSLSPGRYDILILVRAAEAFVPVTVVPLDAYLAMITGRELVFAGLYGAILAVTLAGAVIVLTRTDRPRVILYHIGFQLSYVAYQLSRDGVLSSLLWPGNAWMIHRGYLIMTGVSLVFLQLLMLDLLELRQASETSTLPVRLRPRLLQIIVPLLFIVGLVVVPTSALTAWIRAGRVLLIVMLVVQLVDSGRALVSGEKFRKVRAAGMHIAVWGILAGAAKAAGLLPYAYFQYYALGGMVIESAFFVVSVYMRIGQLSAERLRLDASLRESNLALLQSRGRPHFLANTFAMIRSMMRSDPAGSEHAFELLITDFRFFTDSVIVPLIPLRDEINYINNYLSIMQLRFGVGLIVSRSIPDMLPDTLIPPLSLQPLVENALHHAAQPRTTEARILELSLATIGGSIRFAVANYCTLPNTTAHPGGTTHANILARMRYYHPDATLSLSVDESVFSATLSWSIGVPR